MLIFKKEKAVRELVLEHLDLTRDCLADASRVLDAYLQRDTAEMHQLAARVKKTERAADVCKRTARSVLHEGAFLPQLRSDVHHLVEMVDATNNAAELCVKCLVNESPRVPEEFAQELQQLFAQNLACSNELRRAMKAFFKPKGEIDELHEHVERANRLESEVDVLQANLTRAVFDSSMQLAEKIHLAQLIRHIASISDLAEDAADELETVVMRSVV